MSGVVPLSWPDYVIFGMMLLLSVATGLYHGVYKGGQKTTKQFLLADRNVFSIPVALTILASFISPVTLLGAPGEVYTYGVEYICTLFEDLVMLPTVCVLFVPVFHGLDILTAYEYFHRRFGLPMRLLGAIMFLFQSLFYVSLVMFTPSIAINAVTGIPIWQIILVTGFVCTFYTTIGGLNAVIWTDAFMALIILGVSVAVLILGSAEVGGFSYAWSINAEVPERTDIFQVPLDPTERLTMPGMLFGSYFGGLALFGISNTAVQRFLAARTLKDARISVLLNIPMVTGLLIVCMMEGIVMYAFYNSPDADGVLRSPPNITASDQILIYFVSEQFGWIPCFQGLFISCLVAGALSSISSGLNAMSAVTLVDIIKPFRSWRDTRRGDKHTYSDMRDTTISKIIISTYGLVSMGIAFWCLSLGTLVSLFNTIFGVTGGPLLSAFTLGMTWPRANTFGTLIGACTGFAIGTSVVIGSFTGSQFWLFRISFMWYAFLTFSVTTVTSILLSEVFRYFDDEDGYTRREVNPIYLATFLRPKHFKTNTRVNVDIMEDEEEKVPDGEIQLRIRNK